MKYRKCLIIPYFGKFPNYFQLFLDSCEKNSNWDWLIISDIKDEKFKYPSNVHKLEISFAQLKQLIQSKFDFEISLDTPYKLCDYKPAYGYIFTEYLKEYDFWGYCDLDLIFGNIDHFISDEILDKYDKIGHLGHFTLFRNTVDINSIFMSKIEDVNRYKDVLTSPNIMIFDEWTYISINDLFLNMNKNIYFDLVYADIYPYSSCFQIVHNIPISRNVIIERYPVIAKKIDENVYVSYLEKNEVISKEVMYIHLQKRKMKLLCNNSNYYIVPDSFLPHIKNEKMTLIKYSIINKFFNKKRLKNLYLTVRYKLIVLTHPARKKLKDYLNCRGK